MHLAWSILFLAASCAWLSAAQPIDEPNDLTLRTKRSAQPGRAMMAHGYFLRMPAGYNTYEPQAAMATFAAGNTIAAGAYSTSRRVKVAPKQEQQEEDQEERTDEETPTATPEDKPEEPCVVEEEAPASERIPKQPRAPKAPKSPKPTKRRPAAEEHNEDDDDEEDEDDRVGGDVYKNFFPMVFAGGSSGGRARNTDGDDGGDEGSYTPGLTAIANSFSRGKGAVAASHATAYGGAAPPAPASGQYKKSSPNRYRN